MVKHVGSCNTSIPLGAGLRHECSVSDLSSCQCAREMQQMMAPTTHTGDLDGVSVS